MKPPNVEWMTVTMPDGREVAVSRRIAQLAVTLGHKLAGLTDDQRQAFEVLCRRAETARLYEQGLDST